MSYQVLARKWRPRVFAQVVGQEHVVQVLVNGLKHDRMHHACLFAGARGVGKTTIARIVAKALNCESRDSFEPCGHCSACKAVDEDRYIDLIEVDAASRTKVEDTRELLDAVQYSPNEGRYKIYLIDEVHMLSGHSFNALLKTLEEPPDHVKFLLATTDPQKIPITVLSRCLQLNLKLMLPTQIRDRLGFVLEQEGLAFELAALKILAFAANGSMRDALSLLDQAIAYGDGMVRETGVLTMLGSVGHKPVFDLVKALARGNPKAVMDLIDALADRTPDFGGFLQQILLLLHRIALVQMASAREMDEEDHEMIMDLAKAMSPEDVQLYYQIGLIGQKDLPFAPDPKTGFEMILLRMMAFKPVNTESSVSKPFKENDKLRIAQNEIGESESGPAYVSTEPSDWLGIIQAVNLKGMAKELALHCTLQDVDDKNCNLLLDPKHSQLLNDRIEQRLEKSIQDYYQKPVKLKIRTAHYDRETPGVQLQRERDQRQKEAELEIQRDDNVKALKEAFDAKIIPESIEPLE